MPNGLAMSVLGLVKGRQNFLAKMSRDVPSIQPNVTRQFPGALTAERSLSRVNGG